MKDKLDTSIQALFSHDEQLMDQHGEGILEGGYTREPLDTYAFRFPTCLLGWNGHAPNFFWNIDTGESGNPSEEIGQKGDNAMVSSWVLLNTFRSTKP